jgi:hypothetical protein
LNKTGKTVVITAPNSMKWMSKILKPSYWKIQQYKMNNIWANPQRYENYNQFYNSFTMYKVYIPIPRSCRNIFRLCRKDYKRWVLLLEQSISRYHYVLISRYHFALISRYHFVLISRNHFVLIKVSSFNKPPLTQLF